MNCLVDTHYLLWSLVSPEKIGEHVRQILLAEEHAKYASVVSFWEISIKYALGKLVLDGLTPEAIVAAAAGAGYEFLGLEPLVAATYHQLPKSDDHKDPFDRLLIWQAMRGRMAFLSSDEKIHAYREHGLQTAADVP